MKRIHLPGCVDFANKLLVILVCAATCLMQHSIAVAQTDKLDSRIAKQFTLTDGEVVDLEFVQGPHDITFVEIIIDGEEYTLELHPYSVRSDNFILKEQLADGSLLDRIPGPVRTVKGALQEDKGSQVYGSLLDEGLHAKIVMTNGRTLFIEPVSSKIDEVEFAGRHVVYRPTDTMPHPGKCGMVGGNLHSFEGVRIANERRRRHNGGGPAYPRGGSGGIQVAEVAVDADFEYFSDYGSVQATLARMELIINVVNNQYEQDVEIRHIISGAVIRSDPADPYTSTDAVTLLNQFRNEWLNNQQAIPRDVAHLFTGKEINGGTIGIAFNIGVICTNQAYCLSQSDFNGALVCATDLTAHELGHLWNGSHCNCPSHTMNPSITCANDFNPTFTVPDIVAHRNSRNCLDPLAAENDDLENSIAVGALPATVTGSNEGATTETEEMDLDNTGRTVWWSAVAPADGIMRVSTAGSNFDTQLRIYTNSENGYTDLEHVAFDDDANGTLQAEIQFPVRTGQLYEIRVGGFTNGGSAAQGDVEVTVSFTPAGPTEFFWSDRDLNTGAINNSNQGILVDEGSSGSLYLYYDPTDSEINVGAFIDIATSIPGVIEFTVADALEFDITANGTPFNLRWGDASGETGDVFPDFIDELGAVNVVAGTGMILANTGPTILDEGWDASVGAFLFARVDYNVVGPPGSSTEIITSPGVTGIVNGTDLLNPDFGSIKLTVNIDLPPTTDFFWSTVGIDSGATNDSTPELTFAEGSSGTLFLYYDTMVSELDTGAFIDIETSTNGVIEFTAAETLDFDITTSGVPFSIRWGDAAGATGDVTPNFIDELGAVNVVAGTGILNQNTGPVFFDEGYDFDSEAFLFATVDFDVVGPEGSTVNILTSRGVTGIVHMGELLDPSFGIVTITVSNVLLGDVNCDGNVDLLDVQPFIDLLTAGEYSPKADFDGDGAVTLLDVTPFVEALTGG